jgi:serine/threonine-protein kinase
MASLLKPGVLLREKWRIDRFLGRGATSAVYAATHRNGMRGAIKVLHRELNESEFTKKRFMREGYVANKLEHGGAVRVLDDDVTDDGLVFLVMELLEGVTVKQRWLEADRKLPLPLVLDIVDQVLSVLEAAHAHKIVHRDLKPDNLFIVEGGAIKVLDFGIARLTDPAQEGQAEVTNSSAMMGTPAFMPPEQALSHWDRVDSRTDLFALAATAYTLLSGEQVHPGTTVPELLVAASTLQVAPVRVRLGELDEEIAAVFDRALRFEPGSADQDRADVGSGVARTRRGPRRTTRRNERGASPWLRYGYVGAAAQHRADASAGYASSGTRAAADSSQRSLRVARAGSACGNVTPAHHAQRPVHDAVDPRPARARSSLWIYPIAALLLAALALTVGFLRR